MTDIVETITPDGLRARAQWLRERDELNDSGSTARHLEMAADEIERLRAENTELWTDRMYFQAEIERLRNQPPNDGLSRAAVDTIKELTATVEWQREEVERLTAATTGLRAALGREMEDRKKAEAEIERLRAERAMLADKIEQTPQKTADKITKDIVMPLQAKIERLRAALHKLQGCDIDNAAQEIVSRALEGK